MEISRIQFGFMILLILTGIAAGTSVYTNATSVNTSQVLLMIENNDPKDHTHESNDSMVLGDISAIKASIAKLNANLALEKTARVDADNSLIQRNSNLDAKINERLLPTGSNQQAGLTSFRLDLDSSHIEVGDSFKLSGIDQANTPFVISMVGQDSSDVLPANGQTKGNGEFELSLFIPSNWSPGNYSITVIIGENFDKISFTVFP